MLLAANVLVCRADHENNRKRDDAVHGVGTTNELDNLVSTALKENFLTENMN